MTFAEQLFTALANARTQGGGHLPKERWLGIAQELHDQAIRGAVDACRPPPRVGSTKPGQLRARNPLFDAICTACRLGESTKLTRPMAKRVAVALADIRQVAADLTPEQIQLAADRFRQRHPQWELTATALSTHWGSVIGGPQTRGAKRDPYVEPPEWRARALQVFPEIELPDRWADLSITIRSDIVARTA